MANKLLDLRLVHEQVRGVSRARNEGARHAKYENFIFLDADNTVDETFLASIAETQKNSKIAVATIRTMPDSFDLGCLVFFSLLELFKIFRLRPFGKSFICRQVFFKINGFNEGISLGENVEMLSRAKKFALANKLRFCHISQVSIKCSLRRFSRVGLLPVAFPWLIAYLGVKNLSYKTIKQLP
jgi:glycosyltransferase involved in cell wall biosynthesis